ncbi:hypothetical protein [Blastomonas sp.]|uniref:hypothetical protein n=1 Tax=Blastomonas sp. TaxID=1909299 RepID=UPI00406A7B93
MLKSFLSAAAAALVALGSVAMAGPASAQGTTTGPVQKPNGSLCPSGWTEGGGSLSHAPMRGYCYPQNKSGTDNAIYARSSLNESCAPGYNPEINRSLFCTSRKIYTWSAENNLAKDGKLPKPEKGVRCPTGWASTTELTSCYTTLDNPPPARLSKGKPCGAGEVEEWGIWCTGDMSGVTLAHANGHGSADFNKVYLHLQLNGGDWQSMKCCLSPAAQAYFASRGEGGAPGVSNAALSSDDGGSSSGQSASASGGGPCGSATGAAIGGAVAGEGGAALGSMLGGLGKKKKKSGC